MSLARVEDDEDAEETEELLSVKFPWSKFARKPTAVWKVANEYPSFPLNNRSKKQNVRDLCEY